MRSFDLDNLKTPEDWNKFLLKKYGYGFYEYALCFGVFLRDPHFRIYYSEKIGFPKVSGLKGDRYYEDLKKKIREKKREIKAILKAEELHSDEKSYRAWWLATPPNLLKHLKEISLEIRIMEDELLNKPIWIGGRGRRVDIRNIIASIFAQVSLKNGQTEWTVIEQLFWSFWDFLEGASYRQLLGKEKADLVYYKFQSEWREIAKDSSKKYAIEKWAKILFSISRKKKFVNINFGKKWITIDEKYSRYPLITFPDDTSFREDITLRKATPPLKDFPVKKTRKKEEAFTLYLTKDDYRALMKYEELRKDGNKEISLKRI